MSRPGTHKPVPADDALILIAHYLPQNLRCFKMGREGAEYENPPRQSIHGFFYEQQQDFPVLRAIEFGPVGVEPHSPSLAQAISNLFAGGLIVVSSKDPWHYHFSRECDDSFKGFVSGRTTPDQQSHIQRLTTRFIERVAVPVQFEC